MRAPAKSPPSPPRSRRWTLGLVAISLAAATHLVHRQFETGAADGEASVILPNVEVLRVVSLGHHTSLADLYWLKWVQYVGTPSEVDKGWPLLEHLTEQVVGLDPRFAYAYQAAGVVLASADRYDSSNSILEKGMREIPDRWQLPFLAGVNHWHGLGELRSGGEYLLRASQLAGSPAYLGDLAARLFSSSGTIEEGLDLIELSLRAADDPLIRAGLEQRRDQLLAEQGLRLLELAIAEYRESKARPPASLEDLNDPAVQKFLRHPIAATIRYDSSTGGVTSSILPTRLVVYRRPKVPDALAIP